MIPWVRLDTTDIPGGGSLRLMRRGGEFSIMLGDNELMNSRLSGSEETLAELGCADLGARLAPRVLIGGLGMGFTLRAALASLPGDAQVTVAELVPAVERWARQEMTEVFRGCLDDVRVRVVIADVLDAMRDANGFDAVLLDVDNGPDGLTMAANDGLYDYTGLAAAREALKPGGVLAVWSSGPDAAFTSRLKRSAFAVEEVPTRAGRSRRGARHMIWLATRP